jgi:hypothetical protein
VLRLALALALATVTMAWGCASSSSSDEPPHSAADYDWPADEDEENVAEDDADEDDASEASSTKERKKRKRHKSKRSRERIARSHGLPDSCTPKGDLCLPPPAFVRKLCRHRHPDVAVYMMRRDQPWTHRYVRVEEAHAINPITGRVGQNKLLFGEEVIVLRYRSGANHGEMQVSGMEGYDLLRWDGTCASLAEGELVAWMPPKQVRYALFDWRRLAPAYRRALREDDRVAALEEEQDKACKGATIGRGPQCEKATTALNVAIAKAVRAGIELPQPKRRP